jgi:hypothetical protein
MSASTIIVAINAQTLRGLQLRMDRSRPASVAASSPTASTPAATP